ncbi:MAG: class I SAM-dependent methyltransferase [Vagococcus sp.]|nr:class I SAM-dependent methyltransferase [Vagococcus sp.]
MKELFETNFDKYKSPEKYDEIHDNYQDDLFYLMEFVNEIDEPIIYLACGTGRLTIPMAKSGLNMVGMDLHSGMLSLAKIKAKHE